MIKNGWWSFLVNVMVLTSVLRRRSRPYSLCFLAMSLYPEALKEAHAELVGLHRLPAFSSRHPRLCERNHKEALRWHRVVPMAVAHRLTMDDESHGHFLPQGTVIFPNTW